MKRRLLLVGWDAADWQVIDPLLDAGRMPNLARLIKGGTIATLATLHPPYSPILWTSIATGQRPAQHGITGFIEPTPDGLSTRPVSSLSRRVKALWNIATQSGLRSVVVGWYPSHPAEPIDGVMISNMFGKLNDDTTPPRLPQDAVHPRDWTERLDKLRRAGADVPDETLRLFMPDLDQADRTKNTRIRALARIVAENVNIHAAATHALRHAEWDLACVYYDGIDHLCHGFMEYHPPRLPWVNDGPFALYSGVVAQGYCWHDTILGELLDLAGPQTTVMLVSDHGFESGQLRAPESPAEHAGPSHDHRHFGVLAMAGPGIGVGRRVHGAGLLDITPTILHLFGLPVGRDMEGRVLLDALDGPAPIEHIDSWETCPGAAGQHPADAPFDPAGVIAAMKQLVELGYIAPRASEQGRAMEEAVLEQHYTLAQSYDDAGHPDLADAEYARMLALSPTDHRGFAGRIEALLARRQAVQARAVLDAFDAAAEAVAISARAELDRRELARPMATLVDQDDDEAKRDLHERRKLRQDLGARAEARAALRARVLLAAGETGAAIAAMKALQQAEPGDATRPAFLASFYAQAGDIGAARMYCDTALAADAQDWTTLGLRARLRLAVGEVDAAIADAIASLRLIDAQPALHQLLGEAYARQGAHEAAARALEVARLMRLRATQAGEIMPAAALPVASWPTDRPAFPSRPGGAPPDGRPPVIVVAGLPRSGTSMLMQALAAGGIPVLSDELRGADEDNPRGYLEYGKAKQLADDKGWVSEARGKAVKIVLALLPSLPRGETYRIVTIQRDLREVLASQTRMLQRLGRHSTDLTPQALATQYVALERVALQFVAPRPGIGVLPLRYEDVLTDPTGTAQVLSQFVGGALDVGACAAAIDPSLRRQIACIGAGLALNLLGKE